MNMLLGARTAIAAAVDEFFNRVTLLLPGNGTNGAQNNTFLDSSTNNFTITRNGNTTQGTFSPFSQTGWSMYAGSSGATVVSIYLNGESDFAFGTGDFTIEMFVNLSPSGATQIIYDSRPPLTNGLYPVIYLDNAVTKLKYYVNTTDVITQTSTFTYNVWHHVVVTRTGTSTKMFVDGVQEGNTYTDSNNYLNAASRPSTTNGYANDAGTVGYISNLRIIKGSGPYQSAGSSITVPTSPLTPVTNTVLLTLQSNRFVDTNTQATPKTINLYNGPTIQPFSPFLPTAAYSAATVGGSGYFDGTGDYLSVPANSQFLPGANTDFTFEAWVYLTATPGATSAQIVGLGEYGSTADWSLTINSSRQPVFYFNVLPSGFSITSSTAIALNSWNHIAVTRSGTGSNNLKLFLNGNNVGQASRNDTLDYTGNNLTIGADENGDESNLTGYISGLRLLNGTGYTSISVPTAPPTAITNTVLLANFTNAGITDATAKNVLETVGNAQISTVQSKWGGSSISFDGNGDYLLLRNRPLMDLGSSDFTIEFWVYPNSFSALGYPLFSTSNGAKTNALAIEIATSGNIGAYITGVSTGVWGLAQGSMGTLNATSWNHVALVRSGSTFFGYVNGVKSSSLGSSSQAVASLDGFNIGFDGLSAHLNGYLDDLRITRFARYTGATAPVPTAPFPTQ